jgi:hypothetical protein
MNFSNNLNFCLKKNSYNNENLSKTIRLITDDLEERYGSISVRVLLHDKELRICYLVDQLGISRLFAITFFSSKGHSAELTTIDQEIKSGKPIGKTLRKHNCLLYRNIIEKLITEIPEWMKKPFANERSYAKGQLSELFVKHKNSSIEAYGIITEIYCPDFKPLTNNEISHLQNVLSKDKYSKSSLKSLNNAYKPYYYTNEKCSNALLISPIENILLKEQIYKILNNPMSNIN